MRTNVLAVSLLLGLALMHTHALAQAPTPTRAAPPPTVEAPIDVSADLAAIIARRKIPGMVAVVVEGNRIAASGAAGVRRTGEASPVTLNDKFHLGSCTKSMTATLCALLVEEGKLSWNTTLAQAFPDFAEEMDEGWRDVTLEQLLHNRGGAPKDLDRDGLWGRLWRFPGTPQEARRALLEGVVKHPPEHAPGAQFVYSNAGFSIAGHMCEIAADAPWEELMESKLFRPLGITSAGFGAPGERGRADEPRGHSKGAPVEPGPGADNPAAIGPAGRVHMTIGDWAKYVAMHLRGDAANPDREARLLRPESFDRLHAPFPGEGTEYAMGWGVAEREWGGGRVLTHNGSNTMWFAVTWVAPKEDFAVLVCCNAAAQEAQKGCDEAASSLIRARAVRAGK